MRLRDRLDVTVEAGYRGASVGSFQWDVSDWDDGDTWSGLEPTWIALDGWTVERVTTRRGRDAGHRRHPAGTAQVELVWQTPAGAWSFRPDPPVALGQELRISVQVRDEAGLAVSDVIPLYRGAVRDVRDRWTPARPERPGTFRTVASLVDRFADLGAVDLPELGAAEGLGDLTHQRLERVLGFADIPTYYLRAGTGVVEHQSSTFARNLLDEAQVAVESETGDLYVDREGFIAFRERLPMEGELLPPGRETVLMVLWANDGTAGAVAPSGEFDTSSNLDDVVNQVSMARTGGTAYTVQDAGSVLAYGLRTHQRFDLTCRYDADVEYRADWLLEQLASRTQRIDQVQRELSPYMDDDVLVSLLDIELRDRHDLRWTDGELTMEGTFHVQGVSHRITGDSWTVAVNLWAYAGNGLAPAPAEWGSAHWGTDVWEP